MSHGNGRVLAAATLGWLVPALLVLPLATAQEVAGGESALFAGAVWLLALGPVGMLVAGVMAARWGARAGDAGSAFWVGLTGVLAAVIPVLAVDQAITVLTIGLPVATLLIAPLVIAYVVGFGTTLLARRLRGSQSDGRMRGCGPRG